VIRREGERLFISGPATLAQAAEVLEQGKTQLREGVRVIDLGEVTELDSSLLAMMLAWLREAKQHGKALEFARLPADLATIAGLYGVADLLAPVSKTSH